ncbi:MAG TPA: isochorismatase family protein [Mycobacteriales bacterium]|jgi:nicotinamidase-related amidase|nr:isochorismatase family protein [Mycobacteriales bacterium]
MPEPSLTQLMPARGTALVLQELQNGVVGAETVFPDLAGAAAKIGVIHNATRLATAARTHGIPVIHATAANLSDGFGANRNARLFAAARRAGADNAAGSASVQPVEPLFEPGDLILPRYHGLSPMADGQLDALLRNSGISSLVVAGVSLNVAIPNLVFDAVNHAYRVVVPTDAVAGVPVEYGCQVLDNCLALIATLTTTTEVISAWTGGQAEWTSD